MYLMTSDGMSIMVKHTRTVAVLIVRISIHPMETGTCDKKYDSAGKGINP